jgi:cytochrome c oxidase subunit III
LAWRQLNQTGYFVTGNPATAFFYLLTAVHGLHLLGGLVVWGRTVARMTRAGVELIDIRLSVELCTLYWHYLLLVWLVLFAVLLST